MREPFPTPTKTIVRGQSELSPLPKRLHPYYTCMKLFPMRAASYIVLNDMVRLKLIQVHQCTGLSKALVHLPRLARFLSRLPRLLASLDASVAYLPAVLLSFWIKWQVTYGNIVTTNLAVPHGSPKTISLRRRLIILTARGIFRNDAMSTRRSGNRAWPRAPVINAWRHTVTNLRPLFRGN